LELTMQDIPLFPSDYRRLVAKEAAFPLVNRYVEQNPTLNDTQVTVLSRPGMRKFAEMGEGPVRKIFTSPGAFNNDVFVVSGLELYRVDSMSGAATLIGPISTSPLGDVSMAATSPIGTEVPSYLFIAEGAILWVYTDNGNASGFLEATGTIVAGNQVRIGDVYYSWESTGLDTGSPAGTSSNPWKVFIGTGNATAILNLYNAINAEGEPGVDYSTALTLPHPTVQATNATATDLFVEYREPGIVGNGTITTETGSGTAWAAGTLTGGGDAQLSQIRVPDDAGAVSVAYINSYVIVVPVQDDTIGSTGKFFWIEPGEKIIDALNFANAERSPDRINQVITFGDMFWLFGDTTTEPWVTTGNPDAPMARFQGIIFDRGSWEGTAVKVQDSMIVVDQEGGVFIISGGQKRISTPQVEERIRLAIANQSLSI
jgi:hypothetical protein